MVRRIERFLLDVGAVAALLELARHLHG